MRGQQQFEDLELKPEDLDDPLVVTATMRGLRKFLKEWPSRQREALARDSLFNLHVELDKGLRQASQDIVDIFEGGKYQIFLWTGYEELQGRELREMPDESGDIFLGDPKLLPAMTEIPITYVNRHMVWQLPSEMPPEADYYESRQLFLGNHDYGAIALFKLAQLIQTGGDLTAHPISPTLLE